MIIIQNAACVPVRLKQGNYRISLENSVLQNKKLNGLVGLSGWGDFIFLNPDNENEVLIDSNAIDGLSAFITLVNQRGKSLIKDCNLLNFISTPDFFYHQEYYINDFIDYNNSFVNYKNIANDTTNLILLYYFYQIRQFSKFDNEINGSFSINIQPKSLIEDIKLSDYVDGSLRDKPIKQIVTRLLSDDMYCSYIDIVGQNSEKIENFPLCFLKDTQDRIFYFDKIKIDFEKTFIKIREVALPSYPLNITFIY